LTSAQDIVVVIHSPDHFPYMKLAHKQNVEVIISTIQLSKRLIERWNRVGQQVVMLVDHVEVEQIEAITALRPDLQIQTFFVQ
jgi:hypothetical protein